MQDHLIIHRHQQSMRVRESERKRIARIIHDRIIQPLVGLDYSLSNARRYRVDDIYDQLPLMQEELRHAMLSLRSICAELHTSTEDRIDLVPAIQSLLRSVEHQHGSQIALQIEGDKHRMLPHEISSCLLAVLQEALANIRKHASARHIWIKLAIGVDQVSVVVQDDGVGFEMPKHLDDLLAHHHFGLIGMVEQIEEAQGTLKISSALGQGTCIQVSVPYRLG
jgi:two-component system CheB/CheR fusion protein